jgi:hypothetical protein
MQIYSYSEARQKLADVLDQAENSGKEDQATLFNTDNCEMDGPFGPN